MRYVIVIAVLAFSVRCGDEDDKVEKLAKASVKKLAGCKEHTPTILMGGSNKKVHFFAYRCGPNYHMLACAKEEQPGCGGEKMTCRPMLIIEHDVVAGGARPPKRPTVLPDVPPVKVEGRGTP